MESPLIVTGIKHAARDFLVQGHPYIPTVPRQEHALAIITEGCMRYTCENQTTLLSRGEVLFIRAGHIDRAETASPEPVRYYTMDFSTLNDDFRMERRYTKDETYLLPLFRHITEVYEKRGPDWMLDGIGTLYAILTYLRRTEPDSAHPNYRYQRIAPAMELIRDRLSDPELTVSELADVCGVTAVSLNRSFHSLYGVPVSQYLLNRRMERAKELLLNSSNTVGEVAKAVGFGDIYAFSHAFTRLFGVSPQLCRRQPDRNGSSGQR